MIDHLKQEYLDFYKQELGVGKHCTKSFGWAVWQHRQNEINELHQSNLSRSGHIDRLQKHNAKLQKRLTENGIYWRDLL